MPTENKIAEPLKVERSTVTKLVITGAPRLDPITVFLEDFGRRDCPTEQDPLYWSGQGKITINCWDKSWNAYWGGMGQRTLAQFVINCHAEYVLNCLDRGISSTKFSGDALEQLARLCILQRRRQQTGRRDWELGELSKSEARELWNDCESLSSIETPNECWHHNKILAELFGDEWHYTLQDKANEPNHEFTYLHRVVEAVQEALRHEQQVAA
ncbi:hypothetical protein PFAS1_23175 [Pseudomonas frederiksbergensis]|uniref:hypothetical protein n=1 Tax=Pseudomonas frederiksbergensis TaxID=104087 RepID=UPI000958A93A|nr:hypothetical protein [Pseudomonas frederiksbergensis]APV42084.1 hypothetical protein PFAS1_23175 [Pseudomonas frederiksbergensis]